MSFGEPYEVETVRDSGQKIKVKAHFCDYSVRMIHVPHITSIGNLQTALHEVGHIVGNHVRNNRYESEKFAEKWAVNFMRKHGLTPANKYGSGFWDGDTSYAKSWREHNK